MSNTKQLTELLAPARGVQIPSQLGFIPIPLRQVPAEALHGIAVYLRTDDSPNGSISSEAFTLYRSAETDFTEADRSRLRSTVRNIYIPIADHTRFRRQIENIIITSINDPVRAISERAALTYETSLALMNELVETKDVNAHAQRLNMLAGSVAGLVLADQRAFRHLFEVSNHDFFTATHLVNVGTWMVALAAELGQRDSRELAEVCVAGMLHDLGKVFVDPEILNKSERLSDSEWESIKSHPVKGFEHLRRSGQLPERVLDVCLHHHERLDGTGYPHGLGGEDVSLLSRICAVVDSFDAMTSARPYKLRAVTVSDALLALRQGVPKKYDAQVVEAWNRVIGDIDDRSTADADVLGMGENAPNGRERRRYKRFRCDAPATAFVLRPTADGGWASDAGHEARLKDISRYGMGIEIRRPVPPGGRVRLRMEGNETNGRRQRVTVGTVRHCRRLESGWYFLGLEVVRETAGNEASAAKPTHTTAMN